MELQVIIQGKNDPPKLKFLQGPIIDVTANEKLIVCLIESGMMSCEPSVIIASQNPQGSICLQTSLDKFMGAAIAMKTAAETRWNWTQPEGTATLMPPDKATRKELLERIKKELEEWDEVDNGDS